MERESRDMLRWWWWWRWWLEVEMWCVAEASASDSTQPQRRQYEGTRTREGKEKHNTHTTCMHFLAVLALSLSPFSSCFRLSLWLISSSPRLTAPTDSPHLTHPLFSSPPLPMSHLHRDVKSQEEDASLGLAGLGDDWKQAHPLWNAEVLLILQHHQKRNEDNAKAQSAATQQLFTQTINYVRSLNNYHSQAAVDEAMRLLSQYPSIDQWELAMMNNLRIDDYEECITLIPTLKAKLDASMDGEVDPSKFLNKEMVEKVLADLKRYQTTT